MTRFIVRRVFWLGIVMFGMTIIAFVVSHCIPADPAKVAAGLDANAEQVERTRHDLGLDQSLPVQYGIYLVHLAHGDLGRSILTGRTVTRDLADFFPATLELALWAILLTVALGVPLGVLAALRRGSALDTGIRFFATIWVGMPEFWFAILLQIVFYRNLGWFAGGGRLSKDIRTPVHLTGMYSLDALFTANLPVFVDSIQHLVLPVLALALGRMAVVARLTRSGMLEVLSSDYIRTARAKGLRQSVVVYRHALKNAALPVLTQIGLQFGFLLGGTILIETVFQWPGMGRYAVDAITRVDFNPIMGVALVASLVFVVVNLGVDLCYHLLDPRIQF